MLCCKISSGLSNSKRSYSLFSFYSFFFLFFWRDFDTNFISKLPDFSAAVIVISVVGVGALVAVRRWVQVPIAKGDESRALVTRQNGARPATSFWAERFLKKDSPVLAREPNRREFLFFIFFVVVVVVVACAEWNARREEGEGRG